MSGDITLDCIISGHNLKLDPDSKIITDLNNNISHVKTKCARCGAIRMLHLDNKKSL